MDCRDEFELVWEKLGDSRQLHFITQINFRFLDERFVLDLYLSPVEPGIPSCEAK